MESGKRANNSKRLISEQVNLTGRLSFSIVPQEEAVNESGFSNSGFHSLSIRFPFGLHSITSSPPADRQQREGEPKGLS